MSASRRWCPSSSTILLSVSRYATSGWGDDMTREDEKTVACRCEDISVQEITDAIHDGYADLQSLKRYAKFGLGPCQGKTCVLLAAQVLARETGRTLDPVPYTHLTLPTNREV